MITWHVIASTYHPILISLLTVMPNIAVDTTDAVQVLTAQMDDMQNDSTRVAYQLASPSNRAFTARSSNPDLNGYNEERFDSMVRGSTYSPLLSGKYLNRAGGTRGSQSRQN